MSLEEEYPTTSPPSNANVINVSVASGEVCPSCSRSVYTNKYNVWHFLTAILAFPIGLVAFFFPIKICTTDGMRFGPGLMFVKVAKIYVGIVVAALVIFVLVPAIFGLFALTHMH